jgi:dihydrolipoamide dehydrogenase
MKVARFSDHAMIVVLGGGPAGRIAAMHLAHSGKEVLLAERGVIGGQCLNFGCMVVCALNDAARVVRNARDLQGLGVIDRAPEINYPGLIREMQEVQKKIAGILDSDTRSTGVEIKYGTEAVLHGNEVRLGNEVLRPDAVIAATGSFPAIPDIAGIPMDGVYNPHTLAQMDRLPGKMVILGGGVMAAEFAYIFSSFGCDVTLVARSDVLKVLDDRQRAIALQELEGVTVHSGTSLLAVNGDRHLGSVSVRTPDASQTEIECDALFIATGLSPRSENLHGIAKGPGGEVLVDSHMETSIKGVYAAGDVTGPPYLTPVARHEGIVAAENILGRVTTMDYQFFPQSVNLASEHAFCNPPAGGTVSVSLPGPAGPGTFWKVPYNATGLSKVSVDPETGLLQGVSTSGPGAGIITSYIAFLMQKGYTADDFSSFLEVHPETDGVHGLLTYLSDYLKRKNSG